MKLRHKIIGAVLVAALGFMSYVSYVQNQTIMKQRVLIIEMYQYIVAGCPQSSIN
jgi:predicted small secreted protein